MKRLIWTVAGLLGLALFVRVFVVGLYYVDSGSMEPTVHGAPKGGEYLAVRYGGARDLERFDLVVLLPGGGESEARIKRLVGLPGESLILRGGNLWIDGQLLAPNEPRPPLVPCFDDGLLDVESWFRFTEAWSRVEDELVLDAREVEHGSGRGLLYQRQVFKDHYLDRDGELVLGEVVVADGALRLQVRLDSPPATLRLGLVEQGDVFEVRITPAEGQARFELLRRNAEGEKRLAICEASWTAGFHELFFVNRDDHLSFSLDGEERLQKSYAGNAFLSSDHARRGFSAPTERVFFGGETGRATFKGVRVLRDLHYLPRGVFALDEELILGPAEILVLGDNSRASRDGRDWGPTLLREVLGRPLGVVWPPGHMRRLP